MVTDKDRHILQTIWQLLDLNPAFALIFCQCANPGFRDALIADLKTDPDPERIYSVIHFNHPIDSVLQELTPLLGELTYRHVVVMTGLEHSIRSEDETSEVIVRLNMMRDVLGKKLPCPLMLWLPPYAMLQIMRFAPDFWSWRTGVFKFEQPIDQKRELLNPFQPTMIMEPAESPAFIRNKRVDQLDIPAFLRKRKPPPPVASEIPHFLTDYPAKPDFVVGRDAFIRELHTVLQSFRQNVVISGSAGSGKTTAATEYLSRYESEYAHIAWLTYQDDIKLSMVSNPALITALQLQDDDPRYLFEAMLSKLRLLSDLEKPCLLVLDDVRSGFTQTEFNLLSTLANWQILLTSRTPISYIYTLNVDSLLTEDAIQLYRHYSPDTDETGIRKIIALTGSHTLTLALLARHAAEHHRNASEILQELTETNSTDKPLLSNLTDYMSIIFDPGTLNDDEKRVLTHFALLPAEFLPFMDLSKVLSHIFNGNADLLQPHLTALSQRGWLIYDQATDAYRMHPIIRQLIHRQLPITEAEAQPLIETITEKLSIDQIRDNPVDKFQWVPYGKAILNVFGESQSTIVSELQNNLAMVLKELGEFAGAKMLLEKAMASNEQNFGPDHPTTAVRYSNLALVLEELGDFAGAKTLLKKAIASAEQNFGPEHPATAVSYSNLALVLNDLGDFAGAKTLLEKAITSDEKNFGSDHPTTMERYSYLAVVLYYMGNYTDAKTLMEKAIASAVQNFGPDHPTTTERYSNLATVLGRLGDYTGAKTLLEKAKASAEQNFGPDHPTIAAIYSNLGTVLQDLRDYAEARTLLEKAVASKEKNFGFDHPTTAVSYSNLATVLRDLGDYAQALPYAEKALAILQRCLPEGHPDIATIEGVVDEIRREMAKHSA